MSASLPEPFATAYAGGSREVREAIDDVARASPGRFLVYEARYRDTAVAYVAPLYVRELAKRENWPAAQYSQHRKWGTLGDALTRDCPTCGKRGYLVCSEYCDNKFDPDWHSDLYVLCLTCPAFTCIVGDTGWYSPASSGDR